jgi:acyl-CoA synthetase (AMP-forming)/AMP-acid ligase II
MSTLSEIISEHARVNARKPCIVAPDGEIEFTYETFDRAIRSFDALLDEQGCTRGQRLVIATNNTAEFFVTLIGAMRAGVVAVPVDANLASAELHKIVEHADPHSIVVDERSVIKLADIEVHRNRILVGRELLRSVRTQVEPRDVRPQPAVNDLALILYTSGTTGVPKGVMHSHAGLTARLEAIRDWFSFDETYRSLCMLPTHFGHGLIGNCLSTFYYGGELVLCRPFDLDLVRRIWAILEMNEVHWFSTVPTIVHLLLQTAERRGAVRIPSLKFVTCASAPLRPEDIEKFERYFGIPLLNCYGTTETASWTAFSPRSEGRDKRSVGTKFNCDIRAIDPSANALPPNEPGELQIRGPSVMLGYYKDPELSSRTIIDNWFSTGDYGTVNETGRVYILGRIKEIIIRAGLNIYPQDIDTVLLSHPDIAEAYSLGLEDRTLGESVAAVVVPKEGAVLTEREVIELTRRYLATHKCPERVRFVPAVSKTSRGKVNRSKLRVLFEN